MLCNLRDTPLHLGQSTFYHVKPRKTNATRDHQDPLLRWKKLLEGRPSPKHRYDETVKQEPLSKRRYTKHLKDPLRMNKWRMNGVAYSLVWMHISIKQFYWPSHHLKPFLNLFYFTLSCWKRPSGYIVSMKGCTWSSTMTWLVVRVKVTFTWMAGPKVSHQNIAQRITLPPPSQSASCCRVFTR